MTSHESFVKVATQLTVVAGFLSLALVGPTPAFTATAAAAVSVAVPAVAPPGVSSLGYKDENGIVIAGVPTAVPLSSCTPVSGRDNPHYSGGDVSGHGWWDKGSCTGNQADVYNCLYEFYTDGYWYRKACSPTVRVYPGGGSGNRSTARATCANTLYASWRNHVDVNVVNQADTPEEPYNEAAVACQVF
jgi:hypothetical protein